MRSWVIYHSLTSLEDFLMWELDTLNYDAITACFPSRNPNQPDSLVSLKPNSIRLLIMLRKYIHHLVQDSHLSVASDASDHVLEPANSLHTIFHQFMSWKLNEITTSSPSPPPSNRILSKVQKSFWSCTHVNSCQKYTLYINLHILLNILSKAT